MSKGNKNKRRISKTPRSNNAKQVALPSLQSHPNSLSNLFGLFKTKNFLPNLKLPFELPTINLMGNGLRINGFPIFFNTCWDSSLSFLQLSLCYFMTVNAEVDKLNHKLFTDPGNHTLYRLDTLTDYWYGNTMDHVSVANAIINKCKGVMTNSTVIDFTPIKDLLTTVNVEGNIKVNEMVQRLLRAIGDAKQTDFELCLSNGMDNSVATHESNSPANLGLIIGLPIAALTVVVASYLAYRKFKAPHVPESMPLLDIKK